ncbi:hypothetical protein Nepgr_020952 [Nepenthes gracilis]|uniref:Uncharacterized protein n=1 Tax=Nepenthes gracilis TaxID=150966 RepID=A0AAD3XWV8_NEPGR|nr:hypothetical protein Nepgr_020952 [Nepenthes gracilis]
MKKEGFEKISIDEVQKMQWEALEGHMATWIKVVKYSAKVILPGETKLALLHLPRLSFNRGRDEHQPRHGGDPIIPQFRRSHCNDQAVLREALQGPGHLRDTRPN